MSHVGWGSHGGVHSPPYAIHREYVDVFGWRYGVTSNDRVCFAAYAGSVSLLNAKTLE